MTTPTQTPSRTDAAAGDDTSAPASTTTGTATEVRTPLDTIASMYDAFGRGDIEGILAHLDPEVDWGTQVDAPGAELVAMFRHGTGHGAALHYFGGVAALEFHAFVPLRFLVDGDVVYVDLDLDVEHRGTGKRARIAEVHRFTVRDGLVVEYRNYLDTATMIELHRP